MNDSQRIIGFYLGQSADAAGRTIDQVWQFDHQQLERVHDYIQWLFPTAKASQFQAGAPLVDDLSAAAFQEQDELKARLLRSLGIMLDFYGLETAGEEADVCIRKAANYSQRQAIWQDPPAPGYINHNLLRLTRIMESLILLDLPEYAKMLYLCLSAIQQEVPQNIPARTAQFWRQAAQID